MSHTSHRNHRRNPSRNHQRTASRQKRESLVHAPLEIKSLTPQENDLLRKALLKASSIKSLHSIDSSSMRLLLLKRKIQFCLVQCDWHKKNDSTEMKLINNKRKVLLEILEFYGQRKFKSLDLLQQSFRLLWLNLFRALPDPDSIKTTGSDDEMDFREPSWDHLVLLYEIAFHVVTNTEIDKKIMQKYLRGKFLRSLIHLFSSLDDREPQYVKIILHAIYGRFMALRKDIRLYLSEFCYQYIYDTKCELVDSNSSIKWQGIPEILAIFCSIIQGLNIPVKNDYNLLLRNVLVPLHKAYHLDAFHEELIQCCTQFILKDGRASTIILGGLLKFWPRTSPLKEQLFIDEVVHILNASIDYIETLNNFGKKRKNQVYSAEYLEFENIIIAVFNQLTRCMMSHHHQIAERSLLILKEESLKLCIELYSDKIWNNLYSTLKKMTEKYWLVEIRTITKNVIHELQCTNPEFFKSNFVNKDKSNYAVIKNNDEKSKRKQRECKWRQIRQLAIHQINK